MVLPSRTPSLRSIALQQAHYALAPAWALLSSAWESGDGTAPSGATSSDQGTDAAAALAACLGAAADAQGRLMGGSASQSELDAAVGELLRLGWGHSQATSVPAQGDEEDGLAAPEPASGAGASDSKVKEAHVGEATGKLGTANTLARLQVPNRSDVGRACEHLGRASARLPHPGQVTPGDARRCTALQGVLVDSVMLRDRLDGSEVDCEEAVQLRRALAVLAAGSCIALHRLASSGSSGRGTFAGTDAPLPLLAGARKLLAGRGSGPVPQLSQKFAVAAAGACRAAAESAAARQLDALAREQRARVADAEAKDSKLSWLRGEASVTSGGGSGGSGTPGGDSGGTTAHGTSEGAGRGADRGEAAAQARRLARKAAVAWKEGLGRLWRESFGAAELPGAVQTRLDRLIVGSFDREGVLGPR